MKHGSNVYGLIYPEYFAFNNSVPTIDEARAQ
jgi:hypothetical protein